MCWTIYFLLGIKAAFWGTYRFSLGWPTNDSLNHSIIYGAEAFWTTMLGWGIVFSVIPVLPSSLIYMIIYLIIKKYRKNNDIKKENIND